MKEPNEGEYLTGENAEVVYNGNNFLEPNNLNNKEVKKIATIKETAIAYEPKKTKNIADLEKVPTNLITTENSFEVEDPETKEKKTVRQKVITIEGEEYRVPDSVFKNLKVILKDNPDLEFFKVVVDGEGLQKSYTVIPLKE